MINYPSRGKKREKFPFPSGTRLERPPVLSVLRAKSRELCRRQSQRSVGEEAVVGVAEELGARRGRGLLQQGSVEMSAALRGNFSTSSSSTRMLLHARHSLFLSLSLCMCVCVWALETRLRIVGCVKAILPPPLLIVLPDTPVIFSNVVVSAPRLPRTVRVSGRREWREGSMNYTKEEEESLVSTRLVVDGYGRREVLIGFLRGTWSLGLAWNWEYKKERTFFIFQFGSSYYTSRTL